MLLKVSLLLGVEVHVNVEFVKLVEPPAEQSDDGKCARVCFSFSCVLSGWGYNKSIEQTWANYGYR